MKLWRTALVAVLAALSLGSCGSNDDDDNWIETTPNALYQTAWEGTLTNLDTGESQSVTVTFDRADRATVVCNDWHPYGDEAKLVDANVRYEAKGRTVYFAGSALGGYWIITTSSRSHLVLGQYGSYAYRLTLDRKS